MKCCNCGSNAVEISDDSDSAALQMHRHYTLSLLFHTVYVNIEEHTCTCVEVTLH